MTVRSDQFMLALLKWKGMPTSINNVTSLLTWKVSEGSQARWNPMDTEWVMPNATNYNSVGVKNYATIQDGIEAFWATLEQKEFAAGYQPIIKALSVSQAPAETIAHIDASPWGSHPTTGELHDVVTNFEFYASMPISGSATVTEPTIDNTPAPVIPPPKPHKEADMVELANGDIVSIVITPAGDILEITRKAGTAGLPITDTPENLSVIDITSKYPQFKGATVG